MLCPSCSIRLLDAVICPHRRLCWRLRPNCARGSSGSVLTQCISNTCSFRVRWKVGLCTVALFFDGHRGYVVFLRSSNYPGKLLLFVSNSRGGYIWAMRIASKPLTYSPVSAASDLALRTLTGGRRHSIRFRMGRMGAEDL